MEDISSSSTDDEITSAPTTPQFAGKKLKLNDGSSQDSFKETVVSASIDENVDSGVSADKSESTSSEDPGPAALEGPSNEVVNAVPSGSNVRAIVLNLRHPKWGRNYRKRKTPDRDTDSNGSSNDSDDLSVDETTSASRANEPHSTSETESDDLRRLAEFLNPETDSTCSGPSTSRSRSPSLGSYESGENIIDFNDDSDSDTELRLPRTTRSTKEPEENNKDKMPPVLLKTKPKHNYFLLREIINREMGLSFPCGTTTQEDVMFERRFYGSLHAIYRMQKLHILNKHKGCVNSINFHPEGHLLASGSDDTNVVVWDWARNIALQTIKTGHKSNVFQSKFLFLNAKSQLNIVTCARDGQVRLLQCHPSGGSTVSRRRLASHSRAAHKLHVCESEPHIVISAGEDGLVMQCDVRAEHASRLFQVKQNSVLVPLYSVSGNPRESSELIVAGRDKFVRMYDRRKSTKPLAMFCPTALLEEPGYVKKLKKQRDSTLHLTCAVYNHDGSEILGSYNDQDIYLFDPKKDAYDKNASSEIDGYTHRYSGHRNSATFKGVAFFGPKSEFVVSGSDCSYIYMWDKKSEAIVQWLQGDASGVVNCIEPHPQSPVLATSGLDKDIKIWIPKAQSDPSYEGLELVVRENSMTQLRSPLFNDFLPTLYSAWRGGQQIITAEDDDDDDLPSLGGNIEYDGNVCTTF